MSQVCGVRGGGGESYTCSQRPYQVEILGAELLVSRGHFLVLRAVTWSAGTIFYVTARIQVIFLPNSSGGNGTWLGDGSGHGDGVLSSIAYPTPVLYLGI